MADYSVTSPSEDSRLSTERQMEKQRIAMPAVVLSFNSGSPQRVTVQPTTQMKVTLGDETKYITLPPISNVPIVIPCAQTQGFVLTLPISAGDTGLLIIPDKGIDNFLKTGNVDRPPIYGDPENNKPRSRALEDAIFIPGLSSDVFQISDYKTDKIELRDKERKNFVSVSNNGIEVTDGQATLKIEGGAVTINAPNGVNVTSSSAIAMTTPSTCSINSSNMTLGEGSNSFSGSVETGGDVTAGGISVQNHNHACPHGGNTGPAQ